MLVSLATVWLFDAVTGGANLRAPMYGLAAAFIVAFVLLEIRDRAIRRHDALH